MISTLGLLMMTAFSAPVAATGSQVSTADGDWSNIPLVRDRGSLRFAPDTFDAIEAAAVGECAKPGQSKRNVNVAVPFLIRFTPQGGVGQVVVKNISCPAIEQAVGGAILQMAKDGAYVPTGENQEHWYRGEINITMN